MSHGMALKSCLMLLLPMAVADKGLVRDDGQRALAVDSHGDLEKVPSTKDIEIRSEVGSHDGVQLIEGDAGDEEAGKDAGDVTQADICPESPPAGHGAGCNCPPMKCGAGECAMRQGGWGAACCAYSCQATKEVTPWGLTCKNDGSEGICGYHGYSFTWCRTTKQKWDYCSVDPATTPYGMTCKDDCSGQSVCDRHGEKYSWCRTYGKYDWDYCVKTSAAAEHLQCSGLFINSCLDRLDCAWNYGGEKCQEKSGLVNLYLTESNLNRVIADTVATMYASPSPSLKEADGCVLRAITEVLSETDDMYRESITMATNVVCAIAVPDENNTIHCKSNSGMRHSDNQAPEAQLGTTKQYLIQTIKNVRSFIDNYEATKGGNPAKILLATESMHAVAASASATVIKASRMNRAVNAMTL